MLRRASTRESGVVPLPTRSSDNWIAAFARGARELRSWRGADAALKIVCLSTCLRLSRFLEFRTSAGAVATSALGQTRKCRHFRVKSALPQRTDIVSQIGHVRWRFEPDDRRTSRRPCSRCRNRVAGHSFAVSVGRVELTRLYRGANRRPNDRTCHPQKKGI